MRRRMLFGAAIAVGLASLAGAAVLFVPGVQDRVIGLGIDRMVRLRSEEAPIAPSLVATQAELQQLVQQRDSGESSPLPILQGSREAIAGKDLLALLEGRASVTWNPQRRSVEVRISDSKRR